MMRTKAQTEIIGLVIIVIIITLAMLFYLSYKADSMTDPSKKTTYQTYAYNEIATSFAQSFLETYVWECHATVEELIVDCGSLRGGRITCGFMSSCQKLEEVMVEIKNETLDAWDYPYGLTLRLSSSKKYSYVKYNCTQDTVGRGTPGVFLVPYFPDPGVGTLELGICKY